MTRTHPSTEQLHQGPQQHLAAAAQCSCAAVQECTEFKYEQLQGRDAACSCSKVAGNARHEVQHPDDCLPAAATNTAAPLQLLQSTEVYCCCTPSAMQHKARHSSLTQSYILLSTCAAATAVQCFSNPTECELRTVKCTCSPGTCSPQAAAPALHERQANGAPQAADAFRQAMRPA
jgi:hypothetical protein